jgi:hypothetical protein
MSTSARQRRATLQKAGKPVPRWKSRMLDIGILVSTAVVCVFIFSVSTRFGYSRPQEQQPPIILRTQVLNACGRAGLAGRTADYLGGVTVGRMRFDIVDVGNYNRTDVRESFLINYQLSGDQARQIAHSLDIGPVGVIESDVGANDLGLDVALILGSSVVEPVTEVSQNNQ